MSKKESKHREIMYHASRMKEAIGDKKKVRDRLKQITKAGWRKKHFWNFYNSLYGEK